MTEAGEPIDFYFDFSSPYGYIASRIVDDFEKRVGRPLRWRPTLLGPAFKAMGTAPLVEIPIKGEYAKKDFARSARLHKVPFRYPERFPIGTAAALRAFYWVSDRDPAKARALAKALYGAYFAVKPAKLGEIGGGTILISGQPLRLPVEETERRCWRFREQATRFVR